MSYYRDRRNAALQIEKAEAAQRAVVRLHRLAGHTVDFNDTVTMPNDEFTLKTCEIRDPGCCVWAVASIRWTREGPYLACFGCAQHSVFNRAASLLSIREGVKLK